MNKTVSGDEGLIPYSAAKGIGVVSSMSIIRRVYDTGVLHLLISIVFVQGLTYASQLIVASQLNDPEQFGIIRNMEAVISIVVLIAAVGMPSLAIKSIAEVKDPALRGKLLTRLLSIAGAFGLVVAALAAYLLPRLPMLQLPPQFPILVWVVVLTACSRTCLNYFQGIKRFKKLSWINMGLSLISLVLIVGAVNRLGLTGWLAGRYLSEMLFLICGIIMVGDVLRSRGPLPARYSYSALILLGLPVAIALVIRSALDSAGILLLNYYNQPFEVIGVFGLAALITTAVMLPSAAVNALTLPRLVERVQNPIELRSEFRRLSIYSVALASIMTVLMFVLSPLIPYLFGDKFAASAVILQILILSVPLRVAGSNSGALLLACGRPTLGLVLNIITILIVVVLGLGLTTAHDASATAWIVTVAEGISAALYLATAYYVMTARSRRIRPTLV